MLETGDLMEIYQVLNHVHHVIDLRAWDDLDTVFTEDAVYDLTYRDLPLVEGLTAIRELMTMSQRRDFAHQTGHHATNFYVHEDPDGVVRADSKVISILDDGRSLSADFHDELVRTTEGWRINRRTAKTRDKSARSWTRD
jgi:ketosteroid isomerase-like protein